MGLGDLLELEGRTGAIRGAVQDLGARAAEIRRGEREEQTFEQATELRGLQIQQQENVLQEQERMQELRKQSYDIKTDPMFLAVPEDVQQQWLKQGADAGYWSPEGISTIGAVQDALQSVEQSQELFTKWMKPVVTARESAFNDAQLDVKDYEEKKAGEDLSRDKTYLNLKGIQDRARIAYSQSLNAFLGHQKNISAMETVRDDTAALAAEQREAYVDIFKATMTATGDLEMSKQAAREGVANLFPAAADEVVDELDDFGAEENPLGFTEEELTTAIRAELESGLGRKEKTTKAVKKGKVKGIAKTNTAVTMKALKTRTDRLGYLNQRIPELKGELNRLRVKGKSRDKNKAFEIAKELNFALRQYKSITGKSFTRRK